MVKKGGITFEAHVYAIEKSINAFYSTKASQKLLTTP